MQFPSKTIFAIPGSLRTDSSNHNVLLFLKSFCPPDIDFFIYDDLVKIPPFDPGDDGITPPQPVADLRNHISNAEAVIICTPEYAHGIPGQLKNALDWMVSSSSFSNKPTAIITASTDGKIGHIALIEVLTVIEANLSDDTNLLIPFIRSKMDATGNIVDPKTADKLKTVFNALLQAIA